MLLAYATAPHRTAVRPRIRSTTGARVVAVLSRAGLPAPGVVGVRMALEPGEGRSAVPVRSALLGAVLAVALVVTTLTFGNSLQTLVSNPALYGWNWTYILNPVGAGSGNVPHVAFSLLQHDRYVAGYSGASFNNVEVDGQDLPFLVEDIDASVTPPLLSGHAVDAPRQVVLGAATMTLLHKHLGQFVTVSYGAPADAPIYLPPTRLRIVGTATFPAIGFASTVSDHTSMGTGVLFAFQMFPKAFDAAVNSGPTPALSGPNLALVRLRPGASPAAARASLQHIAAVANKVYAAAEGGPGANQLAVQGVQRPAEIVNYKTIGRTPTLLVSGLALGAVVALALTLLASVRQRRRDLALLKTVGFVRWQLAAAVAWQATVAALVGIAVGIPLGVIAGRWLWDLFARQIYAVPYPTVSLPSVLLVAVGTLVLANLVAAVPARTARARRRPSCCGPSRRHPVPAQDVRLDSVLDEGDGLAYPRGDSVWVGPDHPVPGVHRPPPQQRRPRLQPVEERRRDVPVAHGHDELHGYFGTPCRRSAHSAVHVGPVQLEAVREVHAERRCRQLASVCACSIRCSAAAQRSATRWFRVMV